MNLARKKLGAVLISSVLFLLPFASFQEGVKAESVSEKLQSHNKFETLSISGKEKNFSDNTLVIKYSRPLSASDHQKAGGTVIQNISGLNYVVVKVRNKDKLKQTIQNYQKNRKVVSVNLSPKYKLAGMQDPKTGEQYVHKFLKTAEAQKLAGKNQVKVAVIDTGIDRNHPELKGSIVSSTNIVNPMNTTYTDYHGTHVAGIVAAKKDNGIGGYGISPNVKILSFDVFDGDMWTFDYTIANAILEAVNKGADVINMSLGGTLRSSILEEAVQHALDKGVVVVAAAGNEGSDLPIYPAGYEGVISVGSINSDKKLSEYSSYGAATDLVAPGENIYAPYYDLKKGSTFASLSGTSMAAPAVAGVAALLLSKYPKLTPSEVEYILEKTATDLGTRGFDEKYGNGLVNPVGALKFDVKKIPSLLTKKWDKKEILNNAEKIVVPAKVGHSFTKPAEQKWVKFPVEKGEFIQASLSGSDSYDYKMSIRFYGDDEEQITDINDVRAGGKEGRLIQAPFSGIVAIGVKDVNGSFDDSGKKQSSITLEVDRLKELPEDESTFETPIQINHWPFIQKNLYLTGSEEGDEDYFSFTTKEAQLMKVEVSGVPGVNISLSVYDKSELDFSEPEEFEHLSEDGDLAEELPEISLEDIPPLYSSNSGGIGEGETLSFFAEPEKEYYVKVTNKQPLFDFTLEEILLGFAGEIEEVKPAPSALPYRFKINGKQISEDEDGYSGTIEFEEETSEDISFDDREQVNLLDTVSLPSEIGETISGYLQNTDDQDWYKLTPDATGIYQFHLPVPSEDIPTLELYEIIEEEEDGETHQYLSLISSNIEYNMYSWEAVVKSKLITGLKANKTYFLGVYPNYETFQIPYQGYKISSKLLTENIGDNYEENDTPKDAKDFPAKGVNATFAMPNDVDTYYFTAKEDATYGLKFARTKLSSALKSEYDEELLKPYYGFIAITEDLNRNHKIDENEEERTTYILKASENGNTTGSFKAKKQKAYFLTVLGSVESNSGISLWPYQFNVTSVNKKDEDAGSKVKNNTPSKPIKLKKKNNKSFTASAYMNAGYANGDEDWFVYQAGKSQQVTLTLDCEQDIDGVIEVYKNGKMVAKSDYYGKYDNEVLSLKMTKGNYYIKIKEANGEASINPYSLSVQAK